MSEDFYIAVLLILLGLVAVVAGAYYVFSQKAYVDSKGHVTEIEIPVLGKVKTNFPAIGLCIVGAYVGHLGYDLMKSRAPKLVKFRGEVTLDQALASGTDLVTVGVTSGLWHHSTSPDGAAPRISVEIPVPDSWPSYTAYAFTLGRIKSKPAVIGTRLDDPRFNMRLHQ